MRYDTNFGGEVMEPLIAVRDKMGWNPAKLDTLPTRLMCVISELDEFEEALTNGARGHMAEELADVAMYLLCTLHDLWPGRSWRTVSGLPSLYQTPGEITRPVRRDVVRAMQAWRRVEAPNRMSDAGIALELALLEVVRIAVALDFDIDDSIFAKIQVLRNRGPRNGGKHPDS